MDIKQTLDEISRIEKEKAQLELRRTQNEAELDALAKALAALGVKQDELAAEISRLETGIQDKLDAIRNPARTTAVKSRVDSDIMSALEDR
jgi:septal ring factor EnvC (AmiA/AmiB activator)